jgi:hypothetical protein
MDAYRYAVRHGNSLGHANADRYRDCHAVGQRESHADADPAWHLVVAADTSTLAISREGEDKMNESVSEMIEALERARCREEAARMFYEELAGSDKARKLAPAFGELAHDAELNVRIAAKVSEGLRGGLGLSWPEQVQACQLDPDLADKVMPGGVYRELGGVAGANEVLSMALAREEESLRHYIAQADRPAGRVAQFYGYLAQRSGRRLDALRSRSGE